MAGTNVVFVTVVSKHIIPWSTIGLVAVGLIVLVAFLFFMIRSR